LRSAASSQPSLRASLTSQTAGKTGGGKTGGGKTWGGKVGWRRGIAPL
jgi:hypothetical protein